MTVSQAAVRQLPLAAVLALALCLRLLGLGWSLPTPDHRHPLFHPDEEWAMRNITRLNLAAGQISPGAGQREGALYYYLWFAGAELARLIGVLEQPPWDLERYGTDYARLLVIGRLLNVAFEVLSLLFIYLTLRRITRQRTYAVAGALIFAVLPFEIIYAGYVRTHAIANLFTSAIVYLAFRLLGSPSRARDWLLLGGVTGLAIAARWPTGFVSVVPATVALIALIRRVGDRWRSLQAWIAELRKEVGILAALPGTLLGILVGNPTIFFSFSMVKRHLDVQMKYADAGQFSVLSLLDLGKLWTTFSYLIPYGTLPLLWLLLYAGGVWSLSRRAHLPYALPLLVFVLPYLYLMAKAYRFDDFVREAMPTFPALVVLAVLGLRAFVDSARLRPAGRRWAWSAYGVIVAGSGLFSFDYVASMSRSDPREQLHRYILNSEELRKASLTLYPVGTNYFVVAPALADLESTGITTREGNLKLSNIEEGEYLLLGDLESVDQKQRVLDTLAKLEESDDYTLVAEFRNTPRSMRWARRHLGRAPHDMQYPFPALYLFRRLKATPASEQVR